MGSESDDSDPIREPAYAPVAAPLWIIQTLHVAGASAVWSMVVVLMAMTWHVRRPDTGKGIGEGPCDRHRGIRKGSRRREPVGGSDVAADRKSDGGRGPEPRASPDDGEKSEGRHELAQEL